MKTFFRPFVEIKKDRSIGSFLLFPLFFRKRVQKKTTENNTKQTVVVKVVAFL